MRLFVASGIFHPDSGGPATYLYRLLPELQARGHEIQALAYGNAPTAGYPYPLTRIPFGRLPFGRWINFARAYRQGAAWADLVYINTLGLPRSGDGAKKRVMKVVGDYAWERCVSRGWIPPDEDVDRFQTRRYDLRVEWYKANRVREVRAMDRIIVPSDYLRRMVIGWGADPGRVQVIYNALDAEYYAPDISREEARARLGWAAEGRYLVTMARLTAWKGVDWLIDALAQVPGLTLVIAGDGPQLGALRGRAAACGLADRAVFLGKVPHDQVALYLRAADYLALYSGYEGLSHTILEALYCGTPVIASARGGNPEIVRDGENGLLVSHPDLGALVTALRRAFEGDTRRRLAAGTSKGLERFDWQTLVEQTVEALITV
jgi:glycosyltransferase involved in cell wall biosynthesis